MNQCKHCRQRFSGNRHECPTTGQTYNTGDDGSFLTSAVIAGVTDSALLGTVLGGDLGGAVIGDILNGGDLSD